MYIKARLTFLGHAACFAIESDSNHELPIHQLCPSCSPPVPLPSKRHLQLAHFGAHVLFGQLDRSTEPCGACLSPAPVCQYFIGSRGKGRKHTTQIVRIKNCRNPLPSSFKYAVALESTDTAPSSNIPIRCPLCDEDDPAVWKYNLRWHMLRVHSGVDLHLYEDLWELSAIEKKRMKRVWNKRKDVPKPRASKKQPLTVSAAHSSRMALRLVLAISH